MTQTKTEVVAQIAEMLGVPAPHMSTGSSEPRRIFELANEVLGLGLDNSVVKPDLARGIAESAGIAWTATCESAGSRVTLEGLLLVRDAVLVHVQPGDPLLPLSDVRESEPGRRDGVVH